jgi:kynurenine 3-monooxygenase
MSNEQKQAVVGIVGGGLVGALNAVYFAQRGWKVELYELRPGKLTEETC